MANVKVLGLVLLIGTLTAYLAVRESGIFSQHEELKTAHHDHDWETWKAKHGKTFGVHEESIRKDMFQKQVQWVSEHNSQNNTYEVEVNHFAALTDEEFAALYLGDDLPPVNEESIEFLDEETADEAGGSIDWTSKGAVTGIKNQGQCGSCWSFSATGALEGLKKIKDGKLTSFSEQQLVDCSGFYKNKGCNGGAASNAFDYVKANGIVSESSYPYTGKQGSCHVPNVAKFKISGWKQVPVGDVTQMKAALNKQPLAVSVAASAPVFRSYKTGILDSDACGTGTNHAVLAVGYVSGQYWKIKNSWGSKWGNGGYIKIAMKGGSGICGINIRSTYPY